MLICRQCQFENPDTHKFCQRCGDSLTDGLRVGYAPVPANQELPCGDVIVGDSMASKTDKVDSQMVNTSSRNPVSEAPIWYAILTWLDKPHPNLAPPSDHASDSASASIPKPLDGGAEQIALVEALVDPQPSSAPFDDPLRPTLSGVETGFLDAQQRYQILNPLPISAQTPSVQTPSEQTMELVTRVLDRCPLHPPFLAESGLLGWEDLAPETTQGVIPEAAQMYLDLEEQYPYLPLPQLHDAWRQKQVDIVLLTDRTAMPSLFTVCQQDDISPLQVLHWLREMTEHWAVLQSHQCAYSLLIPDNLRIDPEDSVFCLQRLYPDPSDNAPTLDKLGALWQTLFEQTQRTQNGDLYILCRDLQAGGVSTLSELRQRLESIARSLQMLSALSDVIPADGMTNASVFEANDTDDFDPHSSDPEAANRAADLDNKSVFLSLNSPSGDDELANDNDEQPTIVLPMQLISIEDAGRTITGSQREHNEDCFYVQSQVKKTEIKQHEEFQERTVQAKGLYILCDGMGGHAGGEVASALAVETLRDYFDKHWHDRLPSEQSIQEAIQLANHAIYHQNQQNARLGSGRMGTTLVMVLLHDTEIAVAHVGDSRLYRFSRRLGLEQLTIDHEVGQREIQRGVEPMIAYARPDAYQLTQALGPRDEGFIRPDIKCLELNEDTLLLLCSDGLTDNDFLELHTQSHLEPMLRTHTDLEQELNQLINLANQFNGHDNITAVAIRVKVRPNLGLLNRK